ncbi:MAG: hypothetical protein JNM21_04215 [Taibaiella sp.]|nr:hypothetical protein [Taibaiella sp.]
MKLLHLKNVLFIGICSTLLACAKKEPADLLVKKDGTWDYSKYYYNGSYSGTITGKITFEPDGTGTIIKDTGNAAIKWAATNLTVTIEYYPKNYTHYSIKEESAKKIVLEIKSWPNEEILTLIRK